MITALSETVSKVCAKAYKECKKYRNKDFVIKKTEKNEKLLSNNIEILFSIVFVEKNFINQIVFTGKTTHICSSSKSQYCRPFFSSIAHPLGTRGDAHV